ncbi:HEPN domain-containing protein [Rhizobium sp. MHM7A]|uniref:HEPN domain-containing protein n=1 Tax=Rhizobium sp. MHM7A TaxID=2583233 RepID=UPI001105EE2D|nr:HEPN domain-containing protein [Rhizobium sp. MHM7A]TLX15774.1 HEPN domain-containing protein [Rhizobium sp. MHM7A]
MRNTTHQWLQKAEIAIEEAELILDGERFDYGGACSRAAFAVMFAARAAIEQKREAHDTLAPTSTLDLLKMFDERFKHTSHWKVLFTGLRDAVRLQRWADNECPIITRDHGYKAVEAAKQFLKAVEPYLEREPGTQFKM